jgi:hypothetical protein
VGDAGGEGVRRAGTLPGDTGDVTERDGTVFHTPGADHPKERITWVVIEAVVTGIAVREDDGQDGFAGVFATLGGDCVEYRGCLCVERYLIGVCL